MPSAEKAALWIAGDRLWSTGQPITPARRVEPRTWGGRSGTSLTTACAVGLVSRRVHGERVMAVLAAQHVIEVRRVCRVEGGLQRGAARARDRRRRQARVEARVVRAV